MDEKELLFTAKVNIRQEHDLINELGKGVVSIWRGRHDKLARSLLSPAERDQAIYELDWTMKSRLVKGRIGATVLFHHFGSVDYSPTSITIKYATMTSLIALGHGRRSEPDWVTLEILPRRSFEHARLTSVFTDALATSEEPDKSGEIGAKTVDMLLSAFDDAYMTYSMLDLESESWLRVPFDPDLSVIDVVWACEEVGIDLPEEEAEELLSRCDTHEEMRGAIRRHLTGQG